MKKLVSNCAGLAAALLWVWLGSGLANPVNISYLEGKDPVAPDAITAYGPDLFGDRVNLFNGALEFEHTDLSLPGNNALQVALVRKHTPGQSTFVRGQFGDWDLEVPRIGGSFSGLLGWVTSSGGTNRCSGFSLPPVVSSSTGGGGGGVVDRRAESHKGARTQAGSNAATTSKPGTDAGSGSTVIGFLASDYWRRTNLHIPGQSSQEVLKRSSGYTTRPTDGGSYPLVTHGNWQIDCLPTIQNAAGEGFVAVSPEGLRYRFDWMATRLQTDIKKSGASIGRRDFFLMATQATDRFGNWVRYSYDSANPLLLKRIESSDGRAIDITNVGGRAVSATDGTRTYFYSYGAYSHLTGVQLPDGSRWTLNLAPLVPVDFTILGENANCDFPGDYPPDLLTGTITHPSGATGIFKIGQWLFGRTYVDRVCNYVQNSKTLTTGAVWPRYTFSQALQSKQISGPGMLTMNWGYSYDAPGGWSTCTTALCLRDTRIVTVTEPTGDKTRHVFGNRWRVNEGQLLQLDEGWNGSSALKTTTYRYRPYATTQAYPEQYGASLLPNSDWLSTRHRPQDLRVITLQSTTFTWEAESSAAGFDRFARPILVSRFSSLGYRRTDATRYDDNVAKWVLGQLASLVERTTGLEVEAHDYDSVTALKTASRSFGKQMQSFTYNGDGTLDTVKDAAGRPTRLSQYKRGKPQLVNHPDGSSESQSINNLGNADWRTNGAGTTTSFRYDAMGRVSSINYPGGDAVGYHPTEQAFQQVDTVESGLAAGHWRQTISTGNARRLRYFDALWRERLELRFDASNIAGTTSYEETRYDVDGHKAFESYAERGFTVVDAARSGRATYYDAIDRVVVQRADSELGLLQTTTQYPSDAFRRIVINPRSHSTTSAFQAFDTPSEDNIALIWAPEGVTVAIVRDLFGKPSSITRAGASVAVTRSYVYDGYQRLCKTVEPESGATVQDYDLAGNVSWRASGLGLPGSTCDQSSVPEARKVNFGYDARNRPTSTSYGDGSPWVTRSYTADGLPSTINTPYFGWTLGYNNRRLLTSETISHPLGSHSFGYTIEAHGHVGWMSYPGGAAMDYRPDALGRPTQIPGYVGPGIWYHPNGALGGYTATNGVVHNVTQNIRGLPLNWSHSGLVLDVYRYDANGNVASITDEQERLTTRAMTYDGLDRLWTASGIWGSAQYGYDGVDNLTYSQVGGRVLTHRIGASNRLDQLSGTLNMDLRYDANGNVIQRGALNFQFDIGNRLAAATGIASYFYDGHGRRAWAQTASGRTVLRIYSQAGKLLLTQDSQKGVTWHIHLGDKMVAEHNSATGVRWLHTDALGSPVAVTNSGGALVERTRYEPYGGTAAGTNPDGIGFTGHVNDLETGLVYMQQRYMDPVAGRFISADPLTIDLISGRHFNRYAYASNNPYALVDPDGRAPKCTGSNLPCDSGVAPGFSGGLASGQIAITSQPQAEVNRNVQAVANGVVTAAGWENPRDHDQGFGFRIRISTIDNQRTWIYGHLDPGTHRTFPGLVILKGEHIGEYASPPNGNARGAHLHLELRMNNGTPILNQGDVMPIIGGRISSNISSNREVVTNNGRQSRPHTGTDWVGGP